MKTRATQAELMDNPACDQAALYRTLDQFARINQLFSASRRLLKRHIIAAMQAAPRQSYHLLDVGAGGGDIALWLHRAALKRHLDLEITCLELDPRICTYLREKLAAYPNLHVVQGDLRHLGPDFGPFDFVFANHLLHHLPAEAIAPALQALGNLTRRRLLINDLRRSRLAYVAFNLYAGLFARGSFARADGLLSIRKGFTAAELKAGGAPLAQRFTVTIGRALPSRVYLVATAAGGEA